MNVYPYSTALIDILFIAFCLRLVSCHIQCLRRTASQQIRHFLLHARQNCQLEQLCCTHQRHHPHLIRLSCGGRLNSCRVGAGRCQNHCKCWKMQNVPRHQEHWEMQNVPRHQEHWETLYHNSSTHQSLISVHDMTTTYLCGTHLTSQRRRHGMTFL